MSEHNKFNFLFASFVCVLLVFTMFPSNVSAQQTISEKYPEYFMGILILESEQQVILNSIHKIDELQLGNMVILHPMDQAWDLNLIEEAISEADNLGLYTIFETYNFSDHEVRISPEQFSSWQTKYPHLLGILVQEVSGKQTDMQLWLDNSTGTIDSRLEAEQAIIENISSSMQLEEFKEVGAQVFLQENVVSYASANISSCDVLITKVFNAPNTELMIGLTRGMKNSYDIPAWGLWVDTWREWILPPGGFTGNDVERALYEGWFYGAKYFFFEQGNFFGTLDRDWPEKFIILDENGKLTEYGRALQRFYTFLKNQNELDYTQPEYESSIAVMLGQSGWGGRGKDWGLWNQDGVQGDCDYELLNLFFPGIGDNWQIGAALTGKEFTGLPFGMVDVISIYSPPSVLEQYDLIIGLGWSQLSQAIASNLEDYVQDGGVFLSTMSFIHGNETEDDLSEPYAWTEDYSSLFGVKVQPPDYSGYDISADVWLNSVTFTEDTFWYPWSGTTYDYSNDETWFLKYKYLLSDSENTRVIACVNEVEGENNAFIIENKFGKGYTYLVNTRNTKSLPNNALTAALTDFVHNLCSYYARPMTEAPFPETEYWLSQGQANKTVYLQHDNSTATQTFTYAIKPWEADLQPDTDYIVFEYRDSQVYGICSDLDAYLEVTLEQNQSKLFLLIEDEGFPKVLKSDAILDDAPSFVNQKLTVELIALDETENLTRIYCSDYKQPQYVLGAPFNLTQDYSKQTNDLLVKSDSNFVVGWENSTDVSVVAATASLNNVSWNCALETLTVYAKGTSGQQGTIQVQTGQETPYFLKVDGKQTSAWNYDQKTGIWSTNFVFSSHTAELVFGFKPIVIDQAVVSDNHADVNSLQTVSFHVSHVIDGSDAVGASVFVNGTKYVTNQTGWVSLDFVSNEVAKTAVTITGVEYAGSTDYAKAVNDPEIIWDQLEITGAIAFDDSVPVNSVQTIWLTADYAYVSTVFDDTTGTIFVNDDPMVWSSQNSRWELNVTSDTVGSVLYNVTSFVDEQFGISLIQTQNMDTSIVWDQIQITKTELETNALGETSVKVHVGYGFDQSPVTDAVVSVEGIICDELERGVYGCKLSNWSPLQSFNVEAQFADFEQATKTVSSLHVVNTLLYFVIALLIVVAVAFFMYKRRKK
ncbi:MAG: hypothetical protein ACOWW1_00950 [archaeon]